MFKATVDKNKKQKQVAVYNSYTPVTLKHGQGHKSGINW